MQRRQFITNSCKICILGAAGLALGLDACGQKVAPTKSNNIRVTSQDNIAIIPLSKLSADKPFSIITVDKYPFEIAIEKKEDNTYRTILLMCTHQDNPLVPTGNGYTCTVHGSKFNKQGKVTNGPAEDALHELKTTLQDDSLIIQLEKTA